MRYAQCAWRSSNRKMSWGFVHANMPFIGSASLSGWRWGKCARCATCPSCSSPSRPAAQIPLCQYSSLCPASRTWCSRLKLSLTVYYRHTHKHTHLQHSCSHLYRYTSVWVRGQTGETGVTAQILTKTVNLLPSSPLSSSHWFTKGFPDISSDWFSALFMFFFFFSRTMKTSWSRRSLLLDREMVGNFFTTKALFWGHQRKTRTKKTQKPRTTIH